jgi:hypothetical protein
MELSELGIGLPVLSIAALMELLDDNIEPQRQADRARLAGRPVGTGQARPQGPARAVARGRSAPPRVYDRRLGGAAVDRELEAAVLTSVTTCCRTTSGGEPPERAAAREAHRSARAGAPATPSARCVPPVPPSHWSALRCWPTEARW